MGALAPAFLLAAVAVAVPLWLHLFHRHETRRIAFPALRYLERTERDHARRIRMRQLLLMLARIAVLVFLVGAGARLFVRGRGSAHPPTALIIVLDNSMSSGRVVGERRVLDGLKELALLTVGVASSDDQIWILRAGESWSPSVPTGPQGARDAIAATEVSAAAGDLHAALRRAGELLSTSALETREIHLLSDLQETAFTLSDAPDVSVPVVTWLPDPMPTPNHGITDVLIGGGLPPLQGQRSELTVSLSGSLADDTSTVAVRVVVNGRIRGAAPVPSGATAIIPLPPVESGWVRGWVEADADALRADDRFHFTFQARRAPLVTVAGAAPLFLEESLTVLRDAGRLRTAAGGTPDLLVASTGAGVEGVGAGGVVMVLPPSDPALLPALNRRLADAGVPWRYDASAAQGEDVLRGTRIPEVLNDTRVRQWYELTLVGAPSSPPRTLAGIGGSPWLVEGQTAAGGRYLLVASALDPESSTLPVSTAMVRFLDWAAGQWAASAPGSTSREAGLPLSAPRAATHLALPSDSTVEIDGSRSYRATRDAGFYTFLAGDSVVAVEAVNPAAHESFLEPVSQENLRETLGDRLVPVAREGRWEREVFRVRQGPEIWRPLLAMALLLLVLEAVLASSGGPVRRAKHPSSVSPADA